MDDLVTKIIQAAFDHLLLEAKNGGLSKDNAQTLVYLIDALNKSKQISTPPDQDTHVSSEELEKQLRSLK